jgi:DnaK suppressor protein
MAVRKGPKKKKAVKTAAKRKPAKKPVKKTVTSTRRKPAKKTAGKAIKKRTLKAAPRASKKATKAAAAKSAGLPAAVKKRHELLKALLLKKRNEVVEGLEAQMGRRLIRETGQKIDSAMDSADQSALDVDQGIDYSLLEMKYEQYKDIADAFRKLQNNTYGLCEECGEEIDIKRLQVNPLARFCISCKTKKEEIERIQKEETRFKE